MSNYDQEHALAVINQASSLNQQKNAQHDPRTLAQHLQELQEWRCEISHPTLMELPNPLPSTLEVTVPTQPTVAGSHGLQPVRAPNPLGTSSRGQLPQ
eukprot:9172687-Heterocapsa_arctica.AAC.1